MRSLKVMVAGSSPEIIWIMISESEIPLTDPIYEIINSEIDLIKWKTNFLFLYQDWLNKDNPQVYDINNLVNKMRIDAIVKCNNKISSDKLYYWFDVDRSKKHDFIWKIVQ